MLDLSALESCSELTVEHAKQAASSSDEIRKLLKRVAEVARPGEGCPKILMAIARLVGQDWVEGDLRVELAGNEASTTLIVLADFGVGIRERMFPLIRLAVPLDEFHRALELAPQLVLPLKITDEAGKIVLTPLLTPEEKILAPPSTVDYELDSGSLGQEQRTTAPPPPGELQVLDEAMPEPPEPPDDFAYSNQPITDPPPTPRVEVSGEHRLASMIDDADAFEEAPTKPGIDVPSQASQVKEPEPGVHTKPTVRRMVAIDAPTIAAAKAGKRRDPRRDDD